MTNCTFKTGESREQGSLLPPRIEDYVGPDNPVRAIESYVCALDLAKLGFRHANRVVGAGQPPYDPADLLKLYLYGYINQVRSSRRLEREACRNLELIWLAQEPEAGLSNDRQLPQGELEGAEGGEPQFRASGTRTRPCRRNRRCGRWRPVPWRRQQGEHFHAQEAGRTDRQPWTGRSRLTASRLKTMTQRKPSSDPTVTAMAMAAMAVILGRK